MAQRTHVILEDDFDQSEATENVKFSLDGTSYEIDLNDENAAELREVLAPWVAHARKVTKAPSSRGRRRTGGSSGSSSGPPTNEVREWARRQGWEVSDRGRVSAEVREAYVQAH